MQRIPGNIPGDGGGGVKPFQMSHRVSCAWGQTALVILNLKIECCSFCGVAPLWCFFSPFFLVVLKIGVAKIEQLH